jgi:hypothetical protein
MEMFLIYIFASFFGGIIRGLVGFVKTKPLKKQIILSQLTFG